MYPRQSAVAEREANLDVDVDVGLDFDVAELRRRLLEHDLHAKANTAVPRRAAQAVTATTVAPARRPAPPAARESFALGADLVIGSVDTAATPGWRGALAHTLCTTGPFFLGDAIALLASAFVANAALHATRLDQPIASAGHAEGWIFAAAVLLPLFVAYWLGGLYSEIWVHPVIELRQITHTTSLCLVAAGTAGLLAPPLFYWCLAVWPTVLVLVPLARAVVRSVCSRQSWWGYRTLIIGPPSLARAILRSPKSGLRPVLMTDAQTGSRTGVLPVVNDPDALRSLVRAEGIRHAVVSLPESPTGDMAATIDTFGGVIPHLLVLSDASTLPALWSASRSFGRLSGIEVRNGLLLFTLQTLKRLVDVAVSLAVVVFAAPLLVGIILAIKLTDPGPVFFGHTRIGRHGRRFRTWKFRTMRAGADDLLRAHLARDPAARIEWEETQKLRNDPRVTRVGRFLRRTSLDELPQVWNVLRGDMSLVGPRPIVDDEVYRYGDVIRLYAAVKPGITGLWQASGRTGVGYDERVLLDQFYVRHWSPWLDVFVLAKTVVALLRRDGAC